MRDSSSRQLDDILSRYNQRTSGPPVVSDFTPTRIRISEFIRQLDLVQRAFESVEVSRKAAKSVIKVLSAAAKTIPQASATSLTPVALTGVPIVTPSVAIAGSKSLQSLTTASTSGQIQLSGISQTGTVGLTDSTEASVTGTRNVGSVNNFVLSTSASQGDTLTIDAGDGAETITFGVFDGQVNNSSALASAINAISGVEASYTAEGYLQIAAVDASRDLKIGGTVDSDAVFGIAEQTYVPFNLLNQGLQSGQTLTLSVNGGSAQSITFGTEVGLVHSLDQLNDGLAAFSSVSAALDGSNRITFTADAAVDTITIGGTADAESAFGLEAVTYDPQDLLRQGVTSGETLTIQIEAGSVQTIIFGNGSGEVSSIDVLNDALGALSGITASIDTEYGLTIVSNEAGQDLTIGGTADLAGVFGLASGTIDAVSIFDQGIAPGDTLSFAVDGGPAQSIVFGNEEGEISTLDGLANALANLTGVSASLDGQNRIVAALSSGSSVEVTVSAGLDSVLGLDTQSFVEGDLLAIGIVEGSTLSFRVGDDGEQLITFGSGEGQVRTLGGLNAALGALEGVTAGIDASNRLTLLAEDETAVIVIAGTADIEGVFGLTPQIYQPKGSAQASNEPSGTDLEQQFATFLDGLAKIDSIIERASQTGIENLIGGFSIQINRSGRSGKSISLGGHNLTLKGLGLDKLGLASGIDNAERVKKIEAALATADYVVGRLGADKATLKGIEKFFGNQVGRLNKGAKAAKKPALNLKTARQTAISTRKQLALLSMSKQFSGLGVPNGVNEDIYRQLLEASSSRGGRIFHAGNLSTRAKLAAYLALT